MFLYGAGGHAKVVLDILRNTNIKVTGIFDDNCALTLWNGHKVLGKLVTHNLPEPVIISIGDNNIRYKIANSLNFEFGIAIHSSAIISPSAVIKRGTVVMPGAIIQADTKIGTHVIINTKASVDHDCNIRDFAHIAPGATICGHTEIGEGTLIGAGAVVIPGIKIGRWCRIGAGTVITKNVPDGLTVMSSPVKMYKR